MPLPPPPPPGPPPPPSLPVSFPQSSSKGKGGADNRNLLLNDIRAGTKLKKAVTNDRSAPVIEGKSKTSGVAPGIAVNGGPPHLAGLFAGGAPKLKPTGTYRGQAPFLPPNRRLPEDCPPSPVYSSQSYPSSPKPHSKHVIPPGYGTVRRFPNDMKGMAPLPPPASQKPVLGSNSMSAADLPKMRPGPPLPTKPPNVPSLKPNGPSVPRVPPNKPPPPPKVPPAKNGPPLPNKPVRNRPQSFNEFDKKQNGDSNNRPLVQIKIGPSSPMLTDCHSPTAPSPDIMKSARNASTPNLLQLTFSVSGQRDSPSKEPPPPPPDRKTPYGTRPSPSKPPPLPQQRPPPFPVSVPHSSPINMSQQAPPPPPPHKPMPQMQNKLPLHNPPSSAPPPPPRDSSTRNGDDFESRWYSKFLSKNCLPAPAPFTNCPKLYPSKSTTGNRREQAPPVPTESFRVSSGGSMPMNTQLQLGNKLWARTTSEC